VRCQYTNSFVKNADSILKVLFLSGKKKVSPALLAGVRIFKSFFPPLESEEEAAASVLPRQPAQLALPHLATLVNDFLLLVSLLCLAFILPPVLFNPFLFNPYFNKRKGEVSLTSFSRL